MAGKRKVFFRLQFGESVRDAEWQDAGLSGGLAGVDDGQVVFSGKTH